MSYSTNRNKEMFLNQIREIYEEDLLRKADLVLTVAQEEVFGTFLWMNNKPTLEKTLKELRIPDLLINTKSDVIKACEYIESSELGYSYDTVVSMKQQFEVEKDKYAKIVYLINYYEKEVHKAQTLIKNTQLQNEWLKKENLDENLKRSSTGRELEDIDDKMNEIRHQIKMHHQTEVKIRGSLIPVQAAYDTHHATLLQIQSKYNELQQSIKLSDTFLHPERH